MLVLDDAGRMIALMAGSDLTTTEEIMKNLPYALALTALPPFCLVAILALAAVAERFRAVFWICFACISADIVSSLLLPSNTAPPVLSLQYLAVTSPNWVIYFVMTSLVFLGFRQSRKWLAKGRAQDGDVDALVGELLEVQWRLTSTPSDVYVMVVDVAGSTKMKAGCDVLDAEFSFGCYQTWVKSIVLQHCGRIEATAGDSAISAFGNAKQAVSASWQILGDLDRFNQMSNRLPCAFRLRIALHKGPVLSSLSQVQFSHVIDVAAHVEKVSPVNGMALTDPFTQLLEPSATQSLIPGPEVDGIQTYLHLSPSV
jgi:class 3 adenylate cyclase